jgi:diguanylate cyclase (GGDEF)-like protein
MKVLVLSERNDFTSQLEGILKQRRGIEVYFDLSEIEFLERLRDGSSAVVFVEMKGVGRIELIKRAKEIDPNLSIIAMEEEPTVETVIETMRIGVCDYLTKSLDIERIGSALERGIERYNLHRISEQKEFYKDLAIRDGLTGVYNHRYFHEVLSREIERARRYPAKLSLMMVDVDNFKRYNDINGHLAGDIVLKEVAEVLSKGIRQVDLVARYGGEEFAIILPNTDKHTAHTLAGRLRSRTSQLKVKGEDAFPGGKLTVSIGLATYPEDATTKDSLITRADKALYKAKAHGKNRVFAFW